MIKTTIPRTAPIDLQVHTLNSDGTWQPAALIDYVIQAGFGLIAVTDHDCVASIREIQRQGEAKGLNILTATEMTTDWRGEMTDVLCYGFDVEKGALATLTEALGYRQRENTKHTWTYLQANNIKLLPSTLDEILAKPSSQQPILIRDTLIAAGYPPSDISKLLKEAGCQFELTPIADVVSAAHHDQGVCLIAHPGRGDGFPQFDAPMLDQLRQDVPIDGIEVYYPLHTGEQVTLYLDYAAQHHLLISAGSDSHHPHPKQAPIPYPAHFCEQLLKRLGITLV